MHNIFEAVAQKRRLVEFGGCASRPGPLMSGEHYGGQVALVYLMIVIAIGCFVAHLLSRLAPWMPYTPTLLVVGVLTSVANQLQGQASTIVHDSIVSWETIDGHLLLFVFLPPLLFESAVSTRLHAILCCSATRHI